VPAVNDAGDENTAEAAVDQHIPQPVQPNLETALRMFRDFRLKHPDRRFVIHLGEGRHETGFLRREEKWEDDSGQELDNPIVSFQQLVVGGGDFRGLSLVGHTKTTQHSVVSQVWDGLRIKTQEVFAAYGPQAGRLESVVISNEVKVIQDHAFHSCKGLESVTLPAGLTAIGANAFAECVNLRFTAALPSSITKIGWSAFHYCTSLNKINVPEGVTTIEDNTFCCCTGLASVSLPAGLTSIKSTAFYGCNGLQSLLLPAGVLHCGAMAFMNCRNLAKIEIPTSMKTIKPHTFSGCRNLCRVIFPDGVATIEKRAFANCKLLDGLALPSGLKVIEAAAFSGCTRLGNTEPVVLPAGLEQVGALAFCDCIQVCVAPLTNVDPTAFRGVRSVSHCRD
jgi:hypothetical protein